MDFNRESNVDLGKREEASEGEERGSHETEEGKAAREAERERKTSQQTDDKSNDDLESFFGHPFPSAMESPQQKYHKIDDDLESFFGHQSISARESPSPRQSSQQKFHKIDDDLESFFGHQSISAREPLEQTHHKHGNDLGAERERKTSQQTDDKSSDDLESFFGHPSPSAWKSSQQKDHKIDDDLEAFFAQSSTSASSAWPKPASISNSSNVCGEPARTGSGPATPAASVDDWITILGAAPSFDESQDSRREDQGVFSSRKNERLERTRESAANAISEIRRRDEELQRQQAEKQRAGVLLEAEIKRWSGGKEGNLRVLLSTLHDVLWPECGWTAVSLSDLIDPASVKKTYRNAMLHVHPDKVQQKGATAQQRYIAESIFNLLKEAFSKFNSQELF